VKNKKMLPVRTVSKSKRKIAETYAKSISLTHVVGFFDLILPL
jgi:hypothetical protein